MGIYVEYIACPPEGPLAQIAASIVDFAAWYVEDFAEDGDPQVLALITAVKDHGPAALAQLPPELDAAMDRLVAEFYGFYCDCSRGPRLRTVETSMLRVHRYRLMHEELGGTLDPAVSHLWQYIYTGRPVAPQDRARGYISDDDASWVAWWSLAEIQALRRGLPPRGSVGSTETDNDVRGEDGTQAAAVSVGRVIDAAHDALEFADREQCGLVVTAF